MAFCSKCGSQYQEGERFCTQCGAPASVQPAGSVSSSPSPRPKRGSFPFATCLILFLFIGVLGLVVGGVLLWRWAPWKDRFESPTATSSTPGSSTAKKVRWDEGLDTTDTSVSAAQQQEWAAAAESKAGEVEKAFRQRDVSAVLGLLSPTSRTEYEPGLQATREQMVRFADVLATRKLKAAYPNVADFEVRDGERRFPVTFVRIDGTWYLDQF